MIDFPRTTELSRVVLLLIVIRDVCVEMYDIAMYPYDIEVGWVVNCFLP